MRFFRYVIFVCYGTPFRQLVFIGTVFGLCPLASNMYFAWQAYFVEPAAFGKTVHDCYVTAGTAFGVTLANLIGFALFGLGTKKTLFIIILQSIAVITAFAGIYQGHGLSTGVDKPAETLTTDEHYWTSLYFSIVTWTTLGYGDFVPPADIRMVAAAEALLGYFMFGTIVGLLTSMVGERRSLAAAPPTATPPTATPPTAAPPPAA